MIKLSDIPGIGPRVLERLNRLEIQSVRDLRNSQFEFLTSEFGPAYAKFLYNACRGIDRSPLVRFRDAPDEQSFGHSYTLPKEIYTLTDAKAMLLHLAEKVGERMRKRHFSGKTVHAWLRFTDFSSWGKQTTLNQPTNDGFEIFRASERLIRNSPFAIRNSNRIRAVGISCDNLTKMNQLSLFATDHKKSRIPKLLDLINQKHGENTLVRAQTLPMIAIKEDIPDGRDRRWLIV